MRWLHGADKLLDNGSKCMELVQHKSALFRLKVAERLNAKINEIGNFDHIVELKFLQR